MNSKLLKILIIPLLIILFSIIFSKNNFSSFSQSSNFSSTGFSSTQGLKKIFININWQNILLQVAKTTTEREIGLMNRNQLEKNSGMIFVFEQPKVLAFWMKNTLIPLDIIFLDKNFNILNIENAYPQPWVEDKNLKNYLSNWEWMYVIELNLWEAKSLGLKPWDKINIDEKNL